MVLGWEIKGGEGERGLLHVGHVVSLGVHKVMSVESNRCGGNDWRWGFLLLPLGGGVE